MLATSSISLSYAAPTLPSFPIAVTTPTDCVLKDQDCTGGKTCCQPASPDTMTCEAVNQWYSKCVFQPQCVNATNTNPTKKCEGTADQIMNETACCDATESCVPFGDTWKMCRPPATATCSVTGEQCWGKNDSYTPMSTERPCCREPASSSARGLR